MFGNSYAQAFNSVTQAVRNQQAAEAEAKDRELRAQALEIQRQSAEVQQQEARQRIAAQQEAADARRAMTEAAKPVTPERINVLEEQPGPNPTGPAGIAAAATRFKVGNRIMDTQQEADAAAARENSTPAVMRRMAAATRDPAKRIELTEKLRSMQKEGELELIRDIQSGKPVDQAVARYNELGDRRIDPASVKVEPFEKSYLPGDKPRKSFRVSFKDDSGRDQTIDDTFGAVLALAPVKDLFAAEAHARTAAAAEKRADVDQQQADNQAEYQRGMMRLYQQREGRLAAAAKDEKNPIGAKVGQIEAVLGRKMTEDEKLAVLGITRKSDGKAVPEEFGKLADDAAKEWQKSNPQATPDQLATFRTQTLTSLQRTAQAARTMNDVEDRLHQIRTQRPAELPAAIAEAQQRGLSDATLKSWGYEVPAAKAAAAPATGARGAPQPPQAAVDAMLSQDPAVAAAAARAAIERDQRVRAIAEAATAQQRGQRVLNAMPAAESLSMDRISAMSPAEAAAALQQMGPALTPQQTAALKRRL